MSDQMLWAMFVVQMGTLLLLWLLRLRINDLKKRMNMLFISQDCGNGTVWAAINRLHNQVNELCMKKGEK